MDTDKRHIEEGRDWSIVMTGPASNMRQLDTVAQQVFCRKGLDTFSLTLCGHEHLPAELADGLVKDEAETIARRLREVGAIVSVSRTEDVTNVRHRACDVWATRCTDVFCFTEVDDVVCLLGALNVRENLSDLPEGLPIWKKESSLNHIHVGLGDPPEEAVLEGQRTVDALKNALAQAYPDREFTISHWLGDEVSFWQTAPDSPREAEAGQELLSIGPGADSLTTED